MTLKVPIIFICPARIKRYAEIMC